MEDWEVEQARQEAKEMKESYQRLLRGQQLLQAEELQRRANAEYEAGIKEALKEAGIPEEHWGEIYYGVAEYVPDISKALGKKLGSKLTQKAAKKNGLTRDAKTGQWVKKSSEQAAVPDGRQSLAEIAKAQREGKLDSNKALDKMIEATLGDYFASTMNKQ